MFHFTYTAYRLIDFSTNCNFVTISIVKYMKLRFNLQDVIAESYSCLWEEH